MFECSRRNAKAVCRITCSNHPDFLQHFGKCLIQTFSFSVNRQIGETLILQRPLRVRMLKLLKGWFMLYAGDAYSYGWSGSCMSNIHLVHILVRLLEAYQCVTKHSSCPLEEYCINSHINGSHVDNICDGSHLKHFQNFLTSGSAK